MHALAALLLSVHLKEKVIVGVAVYSFALIVRLKNDARCAEGETIMCNKELLKCICSRAIKHFFLAAYCLVIS